MKATRYIKTLKDTRSMEQRGKMSQVLSKCKMAPELREGEEVQKYFGVQLGDVIRDNIIVLQTDQRLFVRPKKGRKVKEELKEKSKYEVELSDIQAIRRTGALTKDVEIETKDQVFEVKSIPYGSKEMIQNIAEIEGLQKGEWGQESSEKRATKGIIGTTLATIGIGAGAIGLIMGITLMVLGILFTLTIVGAIVGIPLLIVGYWVADGGRVMGMGGAKSGSWGLNTQQEWKRTKEENK